MIMKSVLVAGVALLGVTTMIAKSGGGSQPVHNIRFSFKMAFTGSGGTNSAGPSGSVTGTESQNVAKSTDRESLSLSLKGLVPSGSYGLSFVGNGTNGIVATFTANKSGGAKVTLSSKPNKNGIGIGSLDPLTGVTELDVDEVDSNGVPTTVDLTADTTTPPTFTFMDTVSETGTNGSAVGTLTVSASNKSSKLSLKASGLTAGDSLSLAFIGGTAPTNNTFTASSKGTLTISTPIASDVLDLTEVDLTDSTGTVIAFPLP